MTTEERLASLLTWLEQSIAGLETNHARTLSAGQRIELSVLRTVRGKVTSP